MRVFRSDGMRAADAAAVRAGVPSYQLMRAAGEAVASELLRRWPRARRVHVLCGPGNNGGDGYVAALRLIGDGRDVVLHTLGDPRSGGDAERARRELEAAAGGSRGTLTWSEEATPALGGDVVVDALFGSGLSRPLDDRAAAWVRAVNAAGVPVLAVDVPSGVHADRAGLRGEVVRAAATVQLAGAAFASALAPARAAFGDWVVADIGIPDEALEQHAAGRLLTPMTVAPALAERADEVHKYGAGTVLVVGGSRRYAGAAELAARGAYRAGAGLVTVASVARAPGGWSEVVWEPLEDDGEAERAIAAVGPRRAGATVLGPGWQVAPERAVAALEACPGPVVLDAGALLSELAAASTRHGRVVLTPHHGEAARLLDALGTGARIDADDDPVSAAEALASAFGAIAVVKGAGTVIADRHGRLALSAAGTSAMATAGTGDVLAGVLGACLAAGAVDDAERFARVAAGVLLHGLAGERAAERGIGMIATDLAEALPETRRALLDAAAGRSGVA